MKHDLQNDEVKKNGRERSFGRSKTKGRRRKEI